MATSCTIYVPGLFGANTPDEITTQNEWPPLSHLAAIINRANVTTLHSGSLYTTAFRLAGYTIDANEELPAAAVRLLARQQTVPAAIWCCDPVALQADRDSAVLLGNEHLSITPDESNTLLADLNQHFAEQGLRFSSVTPQQWLVQLPRALTLTTTPLNQAHWQNVRHCAVAGADAQQWRVWLNEIQMLLHQHPLNQRREERATPPINSVWLWGGGAYQSVMAPALDIVYSDDALIYDLARSMGIKSEVLPLDVATLLWGNNENVGLFLFDLTALFAQGDYAAWLTILKNWDNRILKPLLAKLNTGELEELRLITDHYCFVLRRRHLLRWWRRRQPFRTCLAKYAHE